MLERDFEQTLERKVFDYWKRQLADSDFHADVYKRATAKEGGHQLADMVDELTTSVLRAEFPSKTGAQYGKTGKRSRSMGDIWVRNNAKVWHPLNVKTGLVGSESQPNLVSLKKLLKALLNRQIDAYYLLFVKFAVDASRHTVAPFVFLTDLLDWLAFGDKKFITFAAGTGQLMLNAKKFFPAVSEGNLPPKNHPMQTKLEALFALYEYGERCLRENREEDLRAYRERFAQFRQVSAPFTVDPQAQALLGVQ